MIDSLGDRQKLYEQRAEIKLMPLLPTFARLDARAFHTFVKGLTRPFDARLSSIMQDTMLFLVKESNACLGYTQSDEITLTWYSSDIRSQIFFDGRHSKMVSTLAAMCTLKFYQLCQERLPEKYAAKFPTFDCRVWQVPTFEEAANVFLWREWDATKNSISMAAQMVYSHKELHKKHSGELQELLHKKGINWHNYPTHFKRGSYGQRRVVERKFTTDEIEKLPPNHDARKNPELIVKRTEYKIVDMPIFNTITNKIRVIYHGSPPLTNGEDDTL